MRGDFTIAGRTALNPPTACSAGRGCARTTAHGRDGRAARRRYSGAAARPARRGGAPATPPARPARPARRRSGSSSKDAARPDDRARAAERDTRAERRIEAGAQRQCRVAAGGVEIDVGMPVGNGAGRVGARIAVDRTSSCMAILRRRRAGAGRSRGLARICRARAGLGRRRIRWRPRYHSGAARAAVVRRRHLRGSMQSACQARMLCARPGHSIHAAAAHRISEGAADDRH